MLKEILDARKKADRNFWDAHRAAFHVKHSRQKFLEKNA